MERKDIDVVRLVGNLERLWVLPMELAGTGRIQEDLPIRMGALSFPTAPDYSFQIYEDCVCVILVTTEDIRFFSPCGHDESTSHPDICERIGKCETKAGSDKFCIQRELRAILTLSTKHLPEVLWQIAIHFGTTLQPLAPPALRHRARHQVVELSADLYASNSLQRAGCKHLEYVGCIRCIAVVLVPDFCQYCMLGHIHGRVELIRVPSISMAQHLEELHPLLHKLWQSWHHDSLLEPRAGGLQLGPKWLQINIYLFVYIYDYIYKYMD